MSDDTLKIKVEYEIDDSKLNQSLARIQSNTGKVLSGGSGSSGSGSPQTAIDRSLLQAKKLEDRFKVLSDAQKQLASQPGMERNLAKVNQELAGVYGSQKRVATTVSDYIKNLEKEVALRKQARDLINNSEGGNNQFSAHSQRQIAYLQQIVGRAPGGGVVNQVINGAGRAAAGAEEGAGAVGMGIAGGALAAGAAGAALAVGAVVSTFGQLGDRARELASASGTASSQLGQLKAAIEKAGIRTDINATSPSVVGFEKFKQDVSTNVGDFVTHFLDNKPDRDKALQQKLSDGLGQNNEDWRRLKEQGSDLQQDLAIQKQALDEGNFRKQRDYSIQLKNFQVDSALQVRDLNIQASRQQFDQTLAITRYQENFQNKQSAKAFALSQQFAQQNYQIQVGRTLQDYSLNKSYQTQDFGINKARSTEEFNIGKQRQGQDYSESLQKAVMGGASGLDLMWMSRDYRKQQTREAQDFQRSQRNATQDFNITQGRETTALGLNLTRGAQDFSQSQKQTLANRQLEIEGQDYARKYEGIELQTNLNRQTQDLAIAFQKLNINLSRGQQQLNNQGRDLNYDINKSYADFNLQTMRANRGYGYATADFAQQARNVDPLGAAGLGSRDATFADALNRSGTSRGQTDLFKQVNDAAYNANNSIGAQVGDALRSVIDFAKNPLGYMNQQGEDLQKKFEQGKAKYAAEHPDLAAMYGYGSAGGPGGGSGGGGNNSAVVPSITIQTGGNTYTLDPGLTVPIQNYIDEQDRKTSEAITDMVKQFYGG